MTTETVAQTMARIEARTVYSPGTYGRTGTAIHLLADRGYGFAPICGTGRIRSRGTERLMPGAELTCERCRPNADRIAADHAAAQANEPQAEPAPAAPAPTVASVRALLHTTDIAPAVSNRGGKIVVRVLPARGYDGYWVERLNEWLAANGFKPTAEAIRLRPGAHGLAVDAVVELAEPAPVAAEAQAITIEPACVKCGENWYGLLEAMPSERDPRYCDKCILLISAHQDAPLVLADAHTQRHGVDCPYCGFGMTFRRIAGRWTVTAACTHAERWPSEIARLPTHHRFYRDGAIR